MQQVLRTTEKCVLCYVFSVYVSFYTFPVDDGEFNKHHAEYIFGGKRRSIQITVLLLIIYINVFVIIHVENIL